MKKVSLLVICLMLVFSSSIGYADEKAPQKVIELANSKLASFGTDTVIVNAVRMENAKGKTLDQVKEMDEKWKGYAGIADYMKAMMESECGMRLREVQDSAEYYAEIFVMDNLGANVAMTDKTSDYWQGDEAKFQNSFKSGEGSVFVDNVKFDDSAQAYLVQVSVPVIDGGRAIGAITFGIDVDKTK